MTPSSSLVRVVACLNASLLAASALHCEAAETPDRPIHVLFLGDSTPANPGTQPGTYAFLPGQTLAGEAIYFDHSSANTALTPAYLAHFDAVLVVGDEALSAAQKKALEDFAAKGRGVKTLPASARTDDARLRSAALDGVGATVRKEWEGFVAGRAPLKYGGNAHVANYEKRPAPLPLQEPLSARESMKYTQVPADFDLRLFASDPDIFKPIAMAWDERGRLWVAETRDYPNEVRPAGEGNDDIKICEDTDGDGKADKFTVFADRLNIPTSIVFTNGGLLVAQAPHFLFLKDTNGDDKADVRQLLFENAWAVNDTHAGPSSLHWGFDNWLYGSVGYDGFKSRSGPEKSFRQGIFRFRPDGSAIEFLHQFSNNTWGFGYNDAGDLFGSTANNAPSFFCGLPLTHFASGQRLMSAKRINTYDKVHPNTANIRQVDVMGGYTAAAGHMFMNSGALPERLRGKALVTEPTCKLINVFDIRPDGAGFKALDAYNLLASSDEYMSPVAAEVGPDGAVW
ncbi:MAG: PVC-type heme-binding CxxCH protein, partial [Verrucomicrobiota bacterium]